MSFWGGRKGNINTSIQQQPINTVLVILLCITKKCPFDLVPADRGCFGDLSFSDDRVSSVKFSGAVATSA